MFIYDLYQSFLSTQTLTKITRLSDNQMKLKSYLENSFETKINNKISYLIKNQYGIINLPVCIQNQLDQARL